MRKQLLTLLAVTGLGVAPAFVTQAALAQRVVEVSPDLNSQNVPPSTSISGQFEATGGSAIEPRSVRIIVNGEDVTNRSTITRNFFSYRPDRPLPPGQNRVQIEFRNASGQNLAVGWNFEVQQPQANLNITSVTHNAASNPLGPGANFLATVNGTPNSQVSVLLVQDGRTVRQLPAQEVSSGVYVATANIQASDRTNEGILVARLQRQNQTTYAAAPQPVIFSASATNTNEAPFIGGSPTSGGSFQNPSGGFQNPNTLSDLQPTFLSHDEGEEITGRGFTLQGQTLPNSVVNLRVDARVRVLGGVVNVGTETLINQEVVADNQGNFSVRIPAPSIVSSGTRYLVTATARNGNTVSQPTQLTLIQR